MATALKQEREADCWPVGAACSTRSFLVRSIVGGVAGTIAITTMMYMVAPMMLGQPMDVAKMLGSMLGGNWWAGMALHIVNGAVVFPLIFALVLYRLLPGTPTLKGLVWGLTLWALAQTVVMPLMGAGLFSGGMMPAIASLMGHIVYGLLLGWFSGPRGEESFRASRAESKCAIQSRSC